jgi:hypothetical protein
MLVLLADPAIMMRLPHFYDFARRLPREHLAEPWNVRQAYSDTLGMVTTYRGMILDEASLEKICHEGIPCWALRSRSLWPELNLDTPERWKVTLTKSIFSVARDHYNHCRDPVNDIFISCSDQKDIALAATLMYMANNCGRLDPKQSKIVLFKLRTPILDSVDHLKQIKDPGWWHLPIRSYAYERFLLWHIPTTDIQSVELFQLPSDRRAASRLCRRLVNNVFRDMHWFASLVFKPDLDPLVADLVSNEEETEF